MKHARNMSQVGTPDLPVFDAAIPKVCSKRAPAECYMELALPAVDSGDCIRRAQWILDLHCTPKQAKLCHESLGEAATRRQFRIETTQLSIGHTSA
jgi:hypothetical protein